MGIYNSLRQIVKKLLAKNIFEFMVKISHFFISLYLKCQKYSPKIYLSIVAIIKDEGPYIAEWIEYHLLVGVEKFYIYDNESKDNLKEILEPYIKSGIVDYKYFPGSIMQKAAYKDILNKARKETYWIAVIDCDEFIVPISTETIPDLLREYEDYGGLSINWINYGSSGHKNKTNGLVIERFKDHSNKDHSNNKHRKTISNTRYTIHLHVHCASYIFRKFCVNTDRNIVKKGNKADNISDKIRLNHYYTKSYEEFVQKSQRGSAISGKIKSLSYFQEEDRNEVKNDPIMDKYIPVIYKKLEERYKN